jgi:hypothetical protein
VPHKSQDKTKIEQKMSRKHPQANFRLQTCIAFISTHSFKREVADYLPRPIQPSLVPPMPNAGMPPTPLCPTAQAQHASACQTFRNQLFHAFHNHYIDAFLLPFFHRKHPHEGNARLA